VSKNESQIKVIQVSKKPGRFCMINKKELNMFSKKFVVMILALGISQALFASSDIESEASVVESEEALAKSEAARQESAEAQKEMEQERLNSTQVMSKAKAAILQAEQDEKRAINSRLATEKYIAVMKQQKAQLQAKKSLSELNLKKATRALTVVEKQKTSLVDTNTKLTDRNQELTAQIKEFNKQEKTLMAEIRQLKMQHEKNMKLKKVLQMRLSESKSRIKNLQATKGALAIRR
jgi:chromosome segregation ATPase